MAELDLLTEESRFRALMEHTEDSIYFKDRDGRLLGVSHRMAVDLGFSDPSELEGKTDVELFGESMNDQHGHGFGDDVLRSIAQTLVSTVRSSDTVARIGGDEFVIVLETLGGRLDARSVADKVLASVAKPVTVQRHTVTTTVSVGISFYPDDSGDAEALVRAADHAMYLAKAEGKNSWQVCPKGQPGPGQQLRPAEGADPVSTVAGS